ncbi:MAG TPA: diacylglycerol kinase [Gammaproteobacteria bacterium]|nr:diacylglycerol kinase [Gammaproteobacteria bacterium]
MPKPGKTGVARILDATRYSMQGLKAAFVNEAAFRQELLLCVVFIPVGLWLGVDGVERALLIGSLLLVLMVELLNSAIEAIVDRVDTDWSPLAGRAKDIGSAAVFISLLNAGTIWILVLADHYL